MPLELRLRRFHSVPFANIHFSVPTFMVGCNGSGKSNIADAFSFLAETVNTPLQTVFDRRGGIHFVITRHASRYSGFIRRIRAGEADTCGMSIRFNEQPGAPGDFLGGQYAFEVRPYSRFDFEVVREQCVCKTKSHGTGWYERIGTRVRGSEAWLKAIEHWNAPAGLLMPLLASTPPFHYVSGLIKDMRVYSIEPSKLREAQKPDTGALLNSDGGNAASVLQELRRREPELVTRLEEILSSITPNIGRVWTVRQGKNLLLKFRQQWGEDKRLDFDSYSMSDGTLRAFGLLLALFQRPRPSVIVVEEPEATIHPGALGTMLDAVRATSQERVLIVTTHSPDVLDAKWIGPENIRVVNWEDGITRVAELGEMPKAALRDHLMGAGELMRSNALEADPLFENASEGQLSLFEDVE